MKTNTPPPVKFIPGHEEEAKRLNFEITALATAKEPNFAALKAAVTRRNELIQY